MEAGSSAPAERGWGYGGPAVAGVVLATLFFPLISLIAALLLQGGQTDPERRRALRTWAWASGGWILVQIVIVFVLVFAVLSGSSVSGGDRKGPCVGGPDLNAQGRDVTGNGTKFAFPCTFGGTETVSFPTTSG